jgi:hypothetical protein
MALLRTAKSCGPDAPTLASSVADVSARRWWQESPVTKESAEETVKTIARGMPGVSGVTVVTNACAFYHCARGCGRAERPAFPAPLLGQHSPSVFRGVKDFAQLGRIAPRDRGGASCHHSVFDFLSSFRDAPLGAVVVIDSGLARSLSSGRALRGPVGALRNDDLPFQCPRPVFRGCAPQSKPRQPPPHTVSPDGIFRRLPRLFRKARKKPGRNASGAKY